LGVVGRVPAQQPPEFERPRNATSAAIDAIRLAAFDMPSTQDLCK
jgi:hypothetical protein